MAVEFSRSFKYTNATQGKVGLLCKVGTNYGEVDLATAKTDNPIGVLMNEPKQNETANLRMGEVGEVIKMVAGAAITRGVKVGATTGGKVITAGWVTGGTADSWIVGIAMSAAAADLDIVEVLWRPVHMNW